MESHRLILGIVVMSAILVVLFGSNPSITGFVPTDIQTQQLDIDVFDSQRFVISSDDDILTLSSLSISGSVVGSGLVNIYLSDGQAQLLVYTNMRRRGSSMAHITGLAVNDLNIQPGEKLGTIESLPDNYQTRSGPFNNECYETCFLENGLFSQNELYLDVVIDPGTSLHISSIGFSLLS